MTKRTATGIRRTLVLHPDFKQRKAGKPTPLRDADARLQEAVGLALAIDLEVVGSAIVPIGSPKPSTLLGSGKIEEIAARVKAEEIGLVIIDSHLSPIQQRNLEKAWECKVIDRTALILEIFGERARTREGILQVELAALNYQKSRLVRSWTHLERQRGGFGFLGGPGESQIETDRRLIRDRIAKLKRELETVTRTRELHRKTRREVPYPLVAIVGYTNAGKSSLFNRLTHAKVTAADMLFATLDPTIRSLRLPSGAQIMLSDTVGFVSDLPHDLVAAFRATLEEVLGADIILHVRDISHPDSEAQRRDVLTVLRDLFDGEIPTERMIEVHNKIDLLPTYERHAGKSDVIALSALTGEGTGELLAALDTRLEHHYTTVELTIPAREGEAIAWLHSHGQVLSQESEGEMLNVSVRLSEEDHGRFEKMQRQMLEREKESQEET